jgi:hypothetical protein
MKFFTVFSILVTGHYHQPDESDPHPTEMHASENSYTMVNKMATSLTQQQ